MSDKWLRVAQITPEMEKFFRERTDKHIRLVQKYCEKIEKAFPGRFKGIVERGKNHDASKYSDQEREPYVYLTWEYKCKDDGTDWKMPEGMQEQVDQACHRHITNPKNGHHPEASSPTHIPVKESKQKIVDATKMKDINICEMAADFCSMSEERGNSPIDWCKKNIGTKWKFSEEQEELIYEILDAIWEEK